MATRWEYRWEWHHERQPDIRGGATLDRQEATIVPVEQALAAAGAEGWEAVSVIEVAPRQVVGQREKIAAWRILMKRPIED